MPWAAKPGSRRERLSHGRQADRHLTTPAAIELETVIVACAVSAGVHAALTPEHLAEGKAAGLGFISATVLLLALAVALTLRPRALPLVAAVAVLAGLIGSYLLATTSGFPLLHPDREAVDGVALFTKAIEAVGLFAAAHLLWRARFVLALTQRKGTPA